jgi:hypothetical protein
MLIPAMLFLHSVGYSQSRYTEYETKAGYIINLIPYVSWPTSARFYTIGILGKDPFGAILERMVEQAQGPKIMIVHYNSPKEIEKNCHILFISSEYKAPIADVLAVTNTMSILTVADYRPDFCVRGGMVHINTPGSHPIFDVNTETSKQRCLLIKSEFLRVSHQVKQPSTTPPLPCTN